jgi:hypothetical protein
LPTVSAFGMENFEFGPYISTFRLPELWCGFFHWGFGRSFVEVLYLFNFLLLYFYEIFYEFELGYSI